MENTVITVHSSNMGLFNERLAEINKKFEKKGYPLINAECVKEPEMIEVEMELPEFDGSAVWTKRMVKVSDNLYKFNLTSDFDENNIAGVDVKFEGIVDFVDGDENSKVFKVENPDIFKFLDKCECDECHKAIGRNKYIIFSKASEIKSRSDLFVLGTTCAKNYFPFNIHSFLGFLSDEVAGIYGEFDEYCGTNSHNKNYVDTGVLFNIVSFVTKDFNVYKKAEDDCPTKVDVENILFDNRNKSAQEIKYTAPKTPWSDMEQWLKDAYGDTTKISDYNEFMQNIHSVMFDPYKEEPTVRDEINLKYLGIAVYSFVGAKKAHDKELERQAKEKMYRDGVNNEYFGKVGDKFEKELMFEKIIGFEGYYGYTYLLFFRDEEGRVYKWSSSKGSYEGFSTESARRGTCEYEVGKKYTLKGSIKDHSEYKGIKQTVITHCKVLKDEYKSHIFDKKEINKFLEEREKNRKPVEDDLDEIFGVMGIA